MFPPVAVRRALPLTVLLLSLLLAAAGGRAADDGDRGDRGDDHDHDHDRARRAVAAGEMLPLHAIIERIGRTWPGEVMEVELDRDDGEWVYEIKVLRHDGALVELEIDARNGEVTDVDARHDKRRRRKERR